MVIVPETQLILIESKSFCARVCVPTGLNGPERVSRPPTDQLKLKIRFPADPNNGEAKINHRARPVSVSADMHQQIIVIIFVLFIVITYFLKVIKMLINDSPAKPNRNIIHVMYQAPVEKLMMKYRAMSKVHSAPEIAPRIALRSLLSAFSAFHSRNSSTIESDPFSNLGFVMLL